jgi:cellulose synthase/poly-beta-1,6-N-acetylglucosamine synthase-like glycosyltransferase
MRIGSVVELARRFVKSWKSRGFRRAFRDAARYVQGQARLIAAIPARRALRRQVAQMRGDPGGLPGISIIMSTWNRAAMLPRAVGSVLGQRCQDWELIIVDDGSDDDTWAVIAAYARDPRIRPFRRERSGPSAARNFALSQSRAEIIAYLDSDNEWCPDYLTAMLGVFHEHPDLQSAYCAIRRIEPSGSSFVHLTEFDAALLAERNSST